MTNDTSEVCRRYVTDKNELTLLKIEMLGIACEYALEKLERV